MKQIEVIIQKDGITAKEVNPYKAELDKQDTLGHSPSFNLLESFRAYESLPRTYEIDSAQAYSIQLLYKAIPTLPIQVSQRSFSALVLRSGKIKLLMDPS